MYPTETLDNYRTMTVGLASEARSTASASWVLDSGSCPDMFLKARLWERWHSNFRNDALSARLRALFGDVDPAHVHPMDAVEFLDEVQQIGIALAERKVKPEHFARFIPEELKRISPQRHREH